MDRLPSAADERSTAEPVEFAGVDAPQFDPRLVRVVIERLAELRRELADEDPDGQCSPIVGLPETIWLMKRIDDCVVDLLQSIGIPRPETHHSDGNACTCKGYHHRACEPGWVRVGRWDSEERRSLWFRAATKDCGRDAGLEILAVELCAGRHGNDSYASVDQPNPAVRSLWEVLTTQQWSMML
jgi:hypothetical protein